MPHTTLYNKNKLDQFAGKFPTAVLTEFSQLKFKY